MTDLDRLLELQGMYYSDILTSDEMKEYESLKAKIEGKIEKGDKFDVLNEVFEDYPKGWLDMKEDLESQVAKLQRDYSHLLRQKQDCETGKHNLHSIIEKIEAKAYIWDGHESMHYGNAIMKIIHPTWGDAQ
jgi:hypothetical protein